MLNCSNPAVLMDTLSVVIDCSGCSSSIGLAKLFTVKLKIPQNSNTLNPISALGNILISQITKMLFIF